MWNPVRVYGEELGMVIVRAIYGFCVGLALSILAALGFVASFLQALPMPKEVAAYMGWILMAVLYAPSVAIAKALGVKKRFNIALRGSTVYVAIVVIVHALVCTP